jgi:hypothetical protein
MNGAVLAFKLAPVPGRAWTAHPSMRRPRSGRGQPWPFGFNESCTRRKRWSRAAGLAAAGPATAGSMSACRFPEEMSGDGGPGTDPEQLFAVGYAACFQSALMGVARGRHLDASGSQITSRAGIGPTGHGGPAAAGRASPSRSTR